MAYWLVMNKNSSQTITPTRAEKLEWARMAQAAYFADRNDVGHRYSAHAALRDGDSIPIYAFDTLQHNYRLWLIDGQF
jgi:hypothetical protein